MALSCSLVACGRCGEPPPPDDEVAQRRAQCAAQGRELHGGYVERIALLEPGATVERVATVPETMRAEGGIALLDGLVVVGSYRGLITAAPGEPPVFLAAPDDGIVSRLLVIDADGDGHQDVVALDDASESGGRIVLWSRAGRGLRRARVLDASSMVNVYGASFATLKPGALPALLEVWPTHQVVRIHAGDPPGTKREVVGAMALGSDLVHADVRDIDGDGQRELLLAGFRNADHVDFVRVAFADARGRYVRFVDSQVSAWSRQLSGFVDLTGDGVPDLASGNIQREPFRYTLDLARGHADGTFEPARRLFAELEDEPFLVPADLDGDGLAELVVTSRGTIRVFRLRDGKAALISEQKDVLTSTGGIVVDGAARPAMAYWLAPGCSGAAMM